jgi:hypothetical protein
MTNEEFNRRAAAEIRRMVAEGENSCEVASEWEMEMGHRILQRAGIAPRHAVNVTCPYCAGNGYIVEERE